MDTNSTSAPKINLMDVRDLVNRAWSQVELINMAAEAGTVTGEAGNAIAWGCISVQELLDKVRSGLDHYAASHDEDDVVESVDHALSEMLDAHAEVTACINRSEEEPVHPEVVALCKRQTKLALSIIGYRPLTTADVRRKVEFLRKWTEGATLTEEEQKALIASMMPEGGEA